MTTAVPDRLEHGDRFATLVSRRGEPTWEIARAYPFQGEWTEENYLAVRDHLNGSVELSDGCLEFLPMPSLRHQFILEFLFDSLRAHVRRTGLAGRAVASPLPVRLWKGQFREPDVVYLKQERIANVDRQPTGADLVVEIVSPGEDARERDFEKKRTEYARARIPEYWIVDPETRTIHVLTLDGVEPGGPYRVHGEFQPGETATSILLPDFSVVVEDCFAAGEGNTNQADGAIAP